MYTTMIVCLAFLVSVVCMFISFPLQAVGAITIYQADTLLNVAGTIVLFTFPAIILSLAIDRLLTMFIEVFF